MATANLMSDEEIEAVFLETIRAESFALHKSILAIGPSWVAAARLIARCRGTVFVAGVGKSGMIAAKLAGTLCSTGTPSVALDPTAAAHGDLGMVRKGDILLAISRSGYSGELLAILPSLRSRRVPVVALTENKASPLGHASRIVVALPSTREADHWGLVPTASTAVVMAVGDSLALAAMRLRGFTADDFGRNHPGGKLGRQLTLMVRDIMRHGAASPIADRSDGLQELLATITTKRAGAASIVDQEGILVGLVTDCDIRRALRTGKDIRKLSVGQIMNTKPATIGRRELAADAAALMRDRRRPLSVLPVVDGKHRPIGMLQAHDLRAMGL